VGLKVGAQAEAQHGGVAHLGDVFHLVHLVGGEELALVADDHVDGCGGLQRREAGVDVLVPTDHVRHRGQTDAGFDHRDAVAVFVGVVVAVVQVGLDQPDVVAFLLIVESGHQGIGGFGRGHSPEFKVQF